MTRETWERLVERADEIGEACASDLPEGLAQYLQLTRETKDSDAYALVYFARAHAASAFLSVLRTTYVSSETASKARDILTKICGEQFADLLLETAGRHIRPREDRRPALSREAGQRSEAELESVAYLVYDALGFADDGDDIRVILPMRATNTQGLAEGEAAVIGDLIGAIRKAYPRRTVGTQFGSEEDLEHDPAWHHKDIVTLGATNSNQAVKSLMGQDLKRHWRDRPRLWVQLPAKGSPYVGYANAPSDKRSGFQVLADGRCADTAVIVLRAENPYDKARRVAMFAGVETYGTAGAALCLVEPYLVSKLAERANTLPGTDNVEVRVNAGTNCLWPMDVKLSLD